MSEKATIQQFIRADISEVFAAFVEVEMITQFWLEKSSGPLAPDATVEWEFMVPGATETVHVTSFKEDSRIEFSWSDGVEVAMLFDRIDDGKTRVAISFAGFDTTDQAVNAAEGFSIVLCDLKTRLETDKSANLVRDKGILIARSG
jgi:uncharacterized protein YndB with AHSA1/START domain